MLYADARSQSVTLLGGRRVVVKPMGMMNMKCFEEYHVGFMHYLELLGRYSSLSDTERVGVLRFSQIELPLLARAALGLPMFASPDLDESECAKVVMTAAELLVTDLYVFNWFYSGECLKYNIPVIPEAVTVPCSDTIMNLFMYEKGWDGEFVMETDILTLISADLQIHSI